MVEAVAVLISKMPRMRPDLAAGKLGESYESKPDFVKVILDLLELFTHPNSLAPSLPCNIFGCTLLTRHGRSGGDK